MHCSIYIFISKILSIMRIDHAIISFEDYRQFRIFCRTNIYIQQIFVLFFTLIYFYVENFGLHIK